MVLEGSQIRPEDNELLIPLLDICHLPRGDTGTWGVHLGKT